MIRKNLGLFLFLILLTACKQNSKEHTTDNVSTKPHIRYAKGFTVAKHSGYTEITVKNPWPEATKGFTYVLADDNSTIPEGVLYDAFIKIPVRRIVVTSTTHIPALDALNEIETVIGFPGTQYISSPQMRMRIEKGEIAELGANESINTEMLIEQEPDMVMGFSINNENKTYRTIEKSGIPVVYNGDWTEETPLGKAEWIKFFAPFFKKEKEADSIFREIEKEYSNARNIARQSSLKPVVFSGAMFKDVWYMPAGDSWAAQFLEDANARYLWKDSPGTGSLSLSFETVLEKAFEAEYWIGPSHFTAYSQLRDANEHYTEFAAYKNKKIFTFSLTKGATGGLLYYELAPSRPDLVLKDLIKILHPGLLTSYEPFFFKPLED